MTIARGQISTALLGPRNTTGTTSFGTNPAVGSKIICWVFAGDGVAPTSVVDNGVPSKTFVQDVNSLNSKLFLIYRADAINLPASGAYGVTVNYAVSSVCEAIAIEYTGVANGGPESKATGGTTSTDRLTGTTTGSAGDLYVGGFIDNSAANPESLTFNSGAVFTEQWRNTDGADTGLFVAAAADAILVAGGAQSIDWTATNVAWAAGIACYRADQGARHTFAPIPFR